MRCVYDKLKSLNNIFIDVKNKDKFNLNLNYFNNLVSLKSYQNARRGKNNRGNRQKEQENPGFPRRAKAKTEDNH